MVSREAEPVHPSADIPQRPQRIGASRHGVAALLLALACSPQHEQPVQQELRTVRIGTSSLTPLHAALGEILEHTDLLAEYGLKGEFLDFERGKDQHERCVGGGVDATFSCEVAAMVHLDRLPGTAITGSPGSLGAMALVVRQDAEVQSVTDLRGGSVAVLGGASAELAMDGWLAREDLTGSVRLEQAGGHGEDALRQLLLGQVDAVLLWDPWLTQAMDQHPLRIVESSPFWSVVMIYPKHQDSDTWTRYHRALEGALAWGRDHPERTASWAAQRGGFPEDLTRKVLASNEILAGSAMPTLALTPEVQQRLEGCDAWAQQHGMVHPGLALEDRQRPTP